VTIQEHVRTQTAALLRRLAFEVNRAAKSCDEGSVHDLRVAIRRLSRCLKVFSQFYPDQSAKKLRRRLKTLMDAAGTLRDLDIALDLVAEAGIDRTKGNLSYRMAEARRIAKGNLEREVRIWKESGFSKKWRSNLGLSG
jgi:CHAD domain-containing protein